MSQSKFALPRNGFTFKQFFVAHDRCAMKVGTDGILLGAWAPIAQVKHVLDIGTGSGLLALMLAQRTDDRVMLDAVELDEEATAQARENVATSPWGARIQVHQGDIQQWQPAQTRRYELIVSNPPFFCRRCALCNIAARTGAIYDDARSRHALNLCRRVDYRRGLFLRGVTGGYWQCVCSTRPNHGLASAFAHRCRGDGNAPAAPRTAGFLADRGGVFQRSADCPWA